MGEIFIRYVDLPCSINGFVREDADGNYNIYINARLSAFSQSNTLDHEMCHIHNGDFFNSRSINEIESI